MGPFKDRIIRRIGRRANHRMAQLSRRYVCAKPMDKEEIQAGIEFERWLADTCRQCLD